MSLRMDFGSSLGAAASRKRTSLKQSAPKVTKLVKAPQENTKHTPSSYLAEMRLTTEEKLAQTREMRPPRIVELLDITGTSHQKDTALDVDQALFQPFPSDITFQQFHPHQTYELPLTLRNNDMVARHIKVTHEESPYFTVVCQKPLVSKVAPGMEATYSIVFAPDEKKDYHHQLVCVTEREKFVIPVRAIGARALLDFPDEINFSAAPVKYASAKTVLVRNVGNREAKFKLETQNPFSVSPTTAILGVDECMQVSVDFVPQKVGDHGGELTIHYNSGEDVYTQLYGSAIDVNVRLDRSSILLESTFIGLLSQRSVTIHNRSDVVVHYQWKAFASQSEELMQRELRSQQLADEEALSREAFFERCMHNPPMRDRLPILTRSLDMNRKKYLDDERFLYSDEVITIDPVEGDIWPNSQAEVAVVFQPDAANSYSRVAYCDVTGRESRLPLKIRGEGVGPRLQFSFDTLDIQNVFVNSAHAYEVVLENKGDIEAVYSLVPPDTLFGPKFTFAPNSGVLRPGGLQAMQISFCSPVLGEFSEEFQWKVEGAPEPLRLRIRGVVIGPTFQFDVPQIKLGAISYGFLTTCEVVLSNTSEIPMTYRLRVPGEGPSPPPPTPTPGSSKSQRNKEFEIKPHTGTLPPNFHQTVRINFTPAFVKTYSTALVVDVNEAGKEVFSLPISAKSVVSPITLLTPLLDFGRCFIQHPYVQNVELLNNSSLPVKYEMSDQADQRALIYLTPHPKGVIEPHTTLQIPLEVKAQVQGEITMVVVFNILGSTEPPLEVGIYCIGEGPVINVTPAQLNWGVCPVLTPISKTITLSNESLIPAEFECALAREKTIFTVDPISAVIPPDHQLELNVTALIDDCLKFSDKLTIVVSHGVSFTVSLSAEGKGTTVVSHPPLQPRVDLGAHFSRAPCLRKCTLTNRGRRVQALSWTTEGFSALKLKKAEIERNCMDTKDMGTKKQAQKMVEVKKPLFKIMPDKFVLEPYQTQSITLDGYSPIPQKVNERLICHAIIGKNPHKERIMTVDVTAEFIAPLVEFSSRELSFVIYQPPGSKLTQHTQELEVRNVSPLPLTTVLLCGYPFSLLSKGQSLPQVEVQLNPGEKSAVTVRYDSTYCVDRHTRIEENPLAVAYKEHPHRDSIALKSEVHFPNVQFETMEVDFGCILNDTETIRYVTMTNNSPLEVRYAWSFLRRPPVQRVDPEQHDEGVDMQSECESDLLEEDEAEYGEDSGEEDREDSGEEDREEGELIAGEHVEEGVDVQEDAGSETVVDTAGSSSTAPGSRQDDQQTQGASPKYATSIPVTPTTVETHTIAGLGELQVSTGGAPLEHPITPGEDGTPSREDEVHEVLESGLPAGGSVASHEGSGSGRDQEGESTLQEDGMRDSGRGARKSKKKAPPQPWELVTDPFTPISIEQVFDILPLHGLLLPGQSQQVQFTFYGHAGIATEVMAICRVEGGPAYQLRLSGEASGVEYRFSRRHIDLGRKHYGQVQSSTVVLYNSGKVDLEFCAMGVVTDSKQLAPGQVSVSPATGHIPALENQELTIHYLAGTPARFKQTLQIQVAHFEPDTITLVGEGIFPQISFNLPREMTRAGNELYADLRARALARLGLGRERVGGAGSMAEATMDATQTHESEFEVTVAVPPRNLECEMEKVLVGDFALEHAEGLVSTGRPQGSKARGPRPTLPEFYLDFGYVVYGQVVSRLVTLRNTGHCPVSFTTAHTALEGTGFSVDLGDRVRSLPGAPDFERLEFSVRFDPAAVKCPEGHTEALLPFTLVGGPTYPIKLSGEVIRPSMELSCSQLNFGTVICGQCKIVTIRLHNPLHVKCEWTAITDKPPKKIPKHIPLHVRRKMKEKPPPKYFEVDPPSGILLPEQRTDIRVRFMPSEELQYSERIPFAIRQNAESDLALYVEGSGSEPHILFDRTLVEFSPVLPFSPGSVGEVTISNPKPYPVEVYSLSFDRQYLEEEEMLQWLKEYDEQKRLFLPPRNAGDKLPQEVLEAFEREQKQRVSDKPLHPIESEAQVADSAVSVDHPVSQAKLMAPTSSTDVLPQQVGVYELKTPLPSTLALVSVPELSVIESISGLTNATIATLSSRPDLQTMELSPVAAAIARHLGVDLSPTATLAENRRGMAIVVHGPPMSGRSTQAKVLGEKYGAVVLVLDEILIDAISSASTPAGCKAREICIQDAQARAEVPEAPSSLAAPSKKQVSKEGSKDKDKDKDKDKESQLEPPPANPEPPQSFPVRPLEETQFAVPEGSLLPAPLPEDLIVEIFSDQLQHMDCRKGVVFDGIESHFTSSPVVSAALILRAFHNRKHIYFVNICMEADAIGQRKVEIERERERKEEEEALERQRAKDEEKQRIAALLNLDEDEYEALSEEQRKEIDQKRLKIWREKQRQKQKEKEERELLKREREEEERRLEEERRGHRKGKLKDAKTAKVTTIKPPPVTALAEGTAQVPSAARPSRPPSQATGPTTSQMLGGVGATNSGASIMSGGESPALAKRRAPRKMSAKMSNLKEEGKSREPSPLMKKYCYYKAYEEGIKDLLEDWDRVQGDVRPKLPPAPEEPQPPTTKTITPSRKSKGKARESTQEVERVEERAAPMEESREGVGVPLLGVEGVQTVSDVTRGIMAGLPSVEEILEEMGLGPKGPPIPGPVTLQVYPYPLKRRRLDATAHERFVFIATSPRDPNAPQEESKPPEPSAPEDPPPSSRMSKRTGSVRSMDSSDSGSHRRSPHKQPSGSKRKPSQSSMKAASPIPHQHEDKASSEAEVATKSPSHVKLVRFRWVIPPGGQTKLRLLFSSQDEGQFDQTLSFEIAGTRRRYQLFCRGICVVPTLCREPRIVFPCRKKTRKKDEIVCKRFVLSENAFVFGPLHCGKTRERYREGRYPENMETLTISNTCSMETKVAFCFQYDQNATTWLLDPPTMTLQPGESKNLTIWAYPKSAGSFKDALVCCVQHNPNPVVFEVNCEGVEPELKVDTKLLDFKKVLLHRKQSRVLHLQNNTLLPVSWRLSGLDQLGDDFSFSQDHGIVQPKTVFPLNVSFRASKQIAYTKKVFKIEISDVEQIMGLMHVEPVHIQAEAYDVAMDVSFPRGTDKGLDFQCIRVGDEQKLVMQLRNKGKYEIGYNFLFDVADDGQDYSRMFHVHPTHSTLYSGEKSQAVSVTLRTDKEVAIKDQAIVKCQVIDVHQGSEGEVIAKIPIPISARAVFSKFAISPVNDINFGSMALTMNSRKSSTLTLENKGEFEFKYAITKKLSAEQQKQRAASMAAAAAKARTKSREGRDGGLTSSRSSLAGKLGGSKGRGEPSLRTEALGGTQRLVLGMFTVNPAMGSILAGQSQTIIVDCNADKPGIHSEELSIEISDRHKDDPPVTYRLCAEVLTPGINMTDIASIFEEHRVCKQLGVLGQHQFHEDGCIGVYAEEDHKFIFKSVVVGRTSKARFKISNPHKISCDVQLKVNSHSQKESQKQKLPSEFEMEPSSKVTIPSHSHIYATVSFRPPAMQSYSATFEAIPDGTRGKGLSFEICGEGNLPQVAILKPSLCNAKGHRLLLFRRLLLSQSQSLAITLQNTGTIPATVMIETVSGHRSFRVQPPVQAEDEDSELLDDSGVVEPDESESASTAKRDGRHSSGPPPVPFRLRVNETKEFIVTFQPHAAKKCRGELCLRIQDNQFENLPLHLVGEGYEDEVCIESIRGQLTEPPPLEAEKERMVEDVEASRENHLYFGGCPVGQSRQATFTLTNHSSRTAVRFNWCSSLSEFSFNPSLGHLHPRSSKDITITFRTDKTVNFEGVAIFGKLQKITFSQPISEIPDWDDRMKSVRWVNVPQSQLSAALEGGEEGVELPRPSTAPAKKKVIETEQEPRCSEVGGSWDLELFASALADHAHYECPTTELKFRDTLMYQTRAHSFPVKNSGKIAISYQWTTLDSEDLPHEPRPPELHLNETGSIVSEGGELMPFTITPLQGVIPPGEEANFTVRFSPLDVMDAECKFICNIPHLHSEQPQLELALYGRSLMPYCHFELEHSDYLTQRRTGARSGQGATAFGGSWDPSSTRVIEFHSCGVGVKITKRFQMINPTNTGYEFNWTNEGGSYSPFKCLTPKGFVAGGRKYELAFEYLPSASEVTESFWRFSIPSFSLSHSFLLVGHTVEPAVNLDRAYVSFKAMRIGSCMKETVYLLNDEGTAYHFTFLERSCHCDGHSAKLVVSPMDGVIPPHSKLPIEVSFAATQEREYNFNLQCSVRRKPTPLLLNVKAEGYVINVGLAYTSPEGKEVQLPTGRGAKRIIDFGQVPVNERALGQLSVLNHSHYNLEYHWKLSISEERYRGLEEKGRSLVKITPKEGVVEPHDCIRCELAFSPPSKMTLKGCELTLEITNGSPLSIALRGSGVEPQVGFSCMEYDFGPCFLHRSDMPTKKTSITITNNDKNSISVNCLYAKKPHLQVHFEPTLLSPGEDTQAVVEFHPKDTMRYRELVEFEINGLSKKALTVCGEGILMKVELANPNQKVVNFGALRINDKITKTLRLLNHSPISVPFSLSIVPSSSSPALQKEGVLTASPSGEDVLPPKGGGLPISITFHPKERVPQFSEEVTLECAGLSQPLLVVTGCCQGLDVSLDSEHLPFGAVVQHSRSNRRVLMINSGDIGARFNWEADKFAPDFSITPVEGYISSGMEIPFDLMFHPRDLNHDIRYDHLPCHIEGREKPLTLTLTGVCIEQTPNKEVVSFTTVVRSRETRHLTIHNKTNSPWLLRPSIDGEYWSGPETLAIGPSQAGHYELTYHPLTMTAETQKHQGSIFFPLPDGSGQLFNLLGTSEPPKTAGTISREIPCKTSHTELLPIENWLRRPQRFRVTIDPVRPEKFDRSVSLHGLEYLDVPALGRRDYKLNFFSFKEGPIFAKVTFTNKAKEYVFYNVVFKSTPPGIIDTLELTSPVRESKFHQITITNPLLPPVSISTSTNIADITVPPQFIVGGQSKGTCAFEFLPLKVGETTGKLTLQSSDLGTYQYELHLVATPPPPERAVHFTTMLGSGQQQQCRFISYSKGRTEYACKVDSNDFHVDSKNITVASAGSSGQEATVDVTFEPSHLGDTHATLSISSPTGGDYTIPLYGHCLVPKPQGPFVIRAGSSISIPFRNVFTQVMQFSFSVDNPVFTVKASDNLKPRKPYNIHVSYTFDKQAEPPKVTKMGKLVVSGHQTGKTGVGVHGDISWVYYLKGVPHPHL